VSRSTHERREHILAQILEKGHVTVKSLAVEMAVSEATARRDLRSLADGRQVELVYGGATLPRATDFSFRSKAGRNVAAKRVIGQLAASLVADDDRILLDSGTTAFEMIHHLKRRRGLSIIVNSARLAVELGDLPDLNVIVLGGAYRAERMDTVGPLALEALEQLRGYRAFIGADGLSMEFGVAAGDAESAHLFRTAARNGSETVLLVDRAKFLTPSLHKIVDWEAISRVVTEEAPEAAWRKFFEERGIEIICPDSRKAGKARTGSV
jgi:DeoR/GlpR family transcriptional regulator of sugar metabolism